MEDVLTQFINQKIDKRLADSDYIHSIPARVKKSLDNGMYTVELISNGAEYVLPNWTGSELDVGDNVNIFYKGSMFSERTAVIGNAYCKSDISVKNKVRYIKATSFNGEVTQAGKLISKVTFEAVQDTKVFAVMNGNIWGSSDGFNFIRLYMDGTLHEYQPEVTVVANQNAVQCFNLPFDVTEGEHTMEVISSGVGGYTGIYCYVWGQGLRQQDSYEPTNEDDYIYGTNNIIYYIGDKRNPLLPEQLDNNTITTIESVAFSGTDIVSAKIPDGYTRIE